MEDREFQDILDQISTWMEEGARFREHPNGRIAFEAALNCAGLLFGESDIRMQVDPGRQREWILQIENPNLSLKGETAVRCFCNMLIGADSIEMHAAGNGTVCLSVVFRSGKEDYAEYEKF